MQLVEHWGHLKHVVFGRNNRASFSGMRYLPQTISLPSGLGMGSGAEIVIGKEVIPSGSSRSHNSWKFLTFGHNF